MLVLTAWASRTGPSTTGHLEASHAEAAETGTRVLVRTRPEHPPPRACHVPRHRRRLLPRWLGHPVTGPPTGRPHRAALASTRTNGPPRQTAVTFVGSPNRVRSELGLQQDGTRTRCSGKPEPAPQQSSRPTQQSRAAARQERTSPVGRQTTRALSAHKISIPTRHSHPRFHRYKQTVPLTPPLYWVAAHAPVIRLSVGDHC